MKRLIVGLLIGILVIGWGMYLVHFAGLHPWIPLPAGCLAACLVTGIPK